MAAPDFLRLYLYAAGTSEVPRQYHVWSCLALLAATVADRVGIRKFHDALLAPNLYVFLLGPSGSGKNLAIDVATKFVRDVPTVNLYRGRATLQHVIDRLGKPFKGPDGRLVLSNPKLFLVTPELGMSVPSGPYGEDFIKGMTELYTGSLDPISEGTRLHGEVVIRGACLNWLAGTQRPWLLQSIPRDAVEGGFFGRAVVVEQAYHLDRRQWQPAYPEDVDGVVAALHERIAILSQLRGEFRRTPDAAQWEERWYLDRPAPDDVALLPSWKRDHDLLLKLAMVLSLSSYEVDSDLVIRREHLQRASLAVRDARLALPNVIDYARSADTKASDGVSASAILVRDLVRAEGRIVRSAVMQRTRLTAAQIDGVERTLLMSGEVAVEVGRSGMKTYRWAGKRRLPA